MTVIHVEQVFQKQEDLAHPGYRKPKRLWEPTFRCGCGECRYKNPRECPQADSLDAITLWSSRERNK